MQIFTRTDHVSDKALESYLRNELPSTVDDQITRHLSECNYCRCQFRQVQDFVNTVSTEKKNSVLLVGLENFSSTRAMFPLVLAASW